VSDVRTMPRTQAPPTRVATAWLLVALWAALVWWLGSEQFSAGSTSRYLLPLINWLFPDLPPQQRFALLMTIRKLAHPSVYAVLAALAFRAALVSGVSGLARGAAIALAIAVSLAGLDELRQSRTRVRTGAASDVLLDAAGASVALAALGYVRRRGSVEAAASARPGGAP
jgi:VanZ family protein